MESEPNLVISSVSKHIVVENVPFKVDTTRSFIVSWQHLRDGTDILGSAVPLMAVIMVSSPDQDREKPIFPVVELEDE